MLVAGSVGVLATPAGVRAAPGDGRPTKVTGAASPTGAPVLTSGEYVDAIATDQPRHYTVDLAAGVTLHFTPTLIRPAAAFGEGIKDELEIRLETAAGEKCGSTNDDVDQSTLVVPLSVPIQLDPAGPKVTWQSPFDATPCGKPGKYVVRVTRVGQDPDSAVADDQRDESLPLELTVLVEPPADATGLPPPVATLPPDAPNAFVPPAPDFTGSARATSGGAGYSDAPVLSPGLFSATIAGGETRYWKVPLQWGQRLSYGVRFEPAPLLDSSAPVRTWVVNRVRASVKELDAHASTTYDGDADEVSVLRNHTVPVHYTNRRADPDNQHVRPVHLAGWYYIVVQMEPDAELTRVEARIQLAITVLGQRSGVPAYRRVQGAATPESLLAGRRTPLELRPRTLLIAGGVAALVVAGLLVVAPWLRLRRHPR
ncbi:MAG TPA: hypothetical protein VGR21_10830 [Cryptosporangiaceae bacterium]|nr:hypothetical protein [Cryptosporangiaceae bacterium]